MTLAGADAWLARAPGRRRRGHRGAAPCHESGGRVRRPAHRGIRCQANRRARRRGCALGTLQRLDRPPGSWRDTTLPPSPPGARRGRGVRGSKLGALRGVRGRPEACARQRAPGPRRRPAAPGHRDLPYRSGSPPGAPRGLLPADGRRDRGAACRRGRGGPGRRPRPGRYVPVRGGQGPQGGAGRRSSARPTTSPPSGPTCGWTPSRQVRRSGSETTPRGSPPGSSSATRPVSARRSSVRANGSVSARAPTMVSKPPWAPTSSAAPPSTRRTGSSSNGGLALLYPQLPEFETLRARLDGMRRAWRAVGRCLGARVQRALQGTRLPSGRLASAADTLR